MIDVSQRHSSGVFLRRHAVELGYRDRDLARAMRDGVLHRIRQGAYVDASVWKAGSPEQRHRLSVQAVLMSHEPGTVVPSHTSAAVLHGLTLHRPDLRRVHVTVLGGASGRSKQDLVYHQGRLTDDEVVTRDGIAVVGPVRAALESASLTDVEGGMVVLDSLLFNEEVDLRELWAAYDRMQRWPGTLRLQASVRLARPGAQTIGETRVRHLCWWARVPEPELQHEVRDQEGNLVGISDFWWPEQKLLGEFDGAVKYGRYLRPGEGPGDAVFREKRREDQMREAAEARMIRFIWSDLDNKRPTALRLRRALGLAP